MSGSCWGQSGSERLEADIDIAKEVDNQGVQFGATPGNTPRIILLANVAGGYGPSTATSPPCEYNFAGMHELRK